MKKFYNIGARPRENQQCGYASREDLDKPRHQLSLITVFDVHMKKA